MFTKYLMALFALLILIGCADQSVEKYKEKAQVEQEGSNKVENDNLAKKAQKMEADLADRHYFYSAIEGQYQGTAQFGNQSYNIKFNFVRSLPQFFGDRTRQLSEIENDFNNLSFHIQIIQWHPDDTSSAVGCRVSQIRPDIQKGIITIASPDCPNLYTVFLSELNPERSELNERARNLAEKIRRHEISTVDGLIGSIQPTSNANVFQFSVRKIK